MEPVIAIPSKSGKAKNGVRRASGLTSRILAVNIFATLLLGGSFLYLDNFRRELTEENLNKMEEFGKVISTAIQFNNADIHEELIVMIAKDLDLRIRIYAEDGSKIVDSFHLAKPTYAFIDPETQNWQKHAARWLDILIDRAVLAEEIMPYKEPAFDAANAWDELNIALAQHRNVTKVRYAPDRTPVISAALPIEHMPFRASIAESNKTKTLSDENIRAGAMLLTSNKRRLTKIVRAERRDVFLILIAIILLSALLSLYLGRVIVRPIKKLAHAAERASRKRSDGDNIVIPSWPDREDEIGLLSQSLVKMHATLQSRLSATEAFAADVSHEIKNPLASLRSAIEALERMTDPKMREELLSLAASDIRRIDRLISDVADYSRLDVELNRIGFDTINIGELIIRLINARKERGLNRNINFTFSNSSQDAGFIYGDGARIEQVFTNLFDNAVSFSQPGDMINVTQILSPDTVTIRVTDNGPGIPDGAKDKIFNRFHTDRPSVEEFGRHSGLGLSIAKAIVEWHQGNISVCDRLDGKKGACFHMNLPRIMIT